MILVGAIIYFGVSFFNYKVREQMIALKKTRDIEGNFPSQSVLTFLLLILALFLFSAIRCFGILLMFFPLHKVQLLLN